jgi:type II secretory pathway component PulF
MEFSYENITEQAKSFLGRFQSAVKRVQFGTKAQLGFLEDLAVLINDGIPANRAVEMMAQVTTGITREVANTIAIKIAQGQPLADGMRDWFGTNVVEIIRVGEAGGALSQTLQSAINMLSRRGVAIGAFIGALTYPIFVLIAACFVIVYLNNGVLQQFRTFKPISEWPSAGQNLILAGQIIENWWWLALVSLVVIVVTLRRLLSNYVGEFRPQLDNFPPFSLYRRLVAGRLLETLGLLVANGVVFKSAIRVMQYQANPYLNSHLVMIEHLLSMGKTNIADVLDTGLVSKEDLMRLRIMAEVKGFEHGLVRMGLRGTEQATSTMKLISRIVGGAFLMLGAGLILLIVSGLYLTGQSLAG